MKMDVAVIMERVREEVAARRAVAPGHAHSGALEAGRLPTWSTALPQVPIKSEYTVNELLVHADRAFVESAYRTVLKRPADPDGFTSYLDKLRAGEMSKVDVLAELRWSPEGLARSVHVDGLLKKVWLHRLRRTPVIGPLVRWAHAIFRVPSQAEWPAYTEAVQARELQEFGKHLNHLSAQIDARLIAAETASASLASRLALAEDEVLPELKRWQHDATAQLHRLDKTLHSVQAAQGTMHEAVQRQGAATATAQAQLSKLQASSVGHAIAVDEQRARVDAQQAQIRAHEELGSKQQQALAAIQLAMNEQRGALAAQHSQIDGYEATTGELRQALSEFQLAIGDQQSALDVQRNQIGAFEAASSKQRESLAALRLAMDEQRATLDLHNEKVAAYEAAMGEQRAALAAVHLSVDEQRAALEAQQALTGTRETESNEQRATWTQDLAWQKGQLAAHGAALAESMREEEQREANTRALDPFYVAFEERFRGSQELIRERALPYIDIVRAAGAGTPQAPVLDIGCGRGDWLDILREHGLAARGVDSNRVFVDICRGRGLEIIEGDVLDVLRNLGDGSVGAITGMHIAEHLPFEMLVAVLDEAKRVLTVGGVLALETPNPENLWVASHWFYMDPTHRNPLPPEALRWIVEARGFADARIERWTMARELPAPPLLAPDVPGAASVNVLLAQLHAAPDYAIVASRRQ